MESQNHDFLKGLPDSPNNYLLTRSLSKDQSFYILSYIPLKEGLLRPNRFGKPGDKNFVNFEEHAMKRYVPESEQLTDIIYASKAGLKMVESLGYGFFINNIYKPEKWGGKKIGEGSESTAYRANLAGKDVLVKLSNREGIKEMNNFFSGMHHANIPDYTEKFGVTEKISRILLNLQDTEFFESFELAPSPKEYLASRRFLIEDFIEGTQVNKLHKNVDSYVSRAQRNNLSSIQLEEVWPWVARFKKEIKKLEDLFFVAGEVVPKSGVLGKTDFELSNWMIVGINGENKKPKLVLIDQAPAALASGGAVHMVETMERESRVEDLWPKIGKLPAYKILLDSDFANPN